MTQAYLKQWGEHPIPLAPYIILTGLFFIVLLLFYKLKVEIYGREIRITYGIGLVRKTIRPEGIVSVSIVKLPWYVGAGIRMLPDGMLYSLQTRTAVRLDYRGDGAGKTVFIGTPEPEELKRALEHHIF